MKKTEIEVIGLCFFRILISLRSNDYSQSEFSDYRI